MPVTVEQQDAVLEKKFRVRRSNRAPSLYWWSLPISLSTFARIFAGSLQECRALVHPADALRTDDTQLRGVPFPGRTLLVRDVAPLLREYEAGRVRACRIAIFPASRSEADLERSAPGMSKDFERLGFTMAIVPEDPEAQRFRYCFRVPGQVIAALEHLALERGFGGNPGQVEMALLQGLSLRPNQQARLSLIMRHGEAAVVGFSRGGSRRIHYLESSKGYTGTYENKGLREVIEERLREAWRRFPVGIVMFAGLPFFIVAFSIRNHFFGRNVGKQDRPGSVHESNNEDLNATRAALSSKG